MRVKAITATTVSVILTLVFGLRALAEAPKLLHSQRSLYREVMVYEIGRERCMCFTRNCRIGRQSCIEMRNPDLIGMNYPKMMLGSLYLQPRPRSILIIGLGGGTLPRALAKVLPDAVIDVVEIDPAVVSAAKRYFGFVSGQRMRVSELDGRLYVRRAIRQGRRYDMIMLDAFDHEYIPEHLLTQDFLREIKTLLVPGGVLAANTYSSSRLYDHESTTYASVFGSFFNLKLDNRVILITNGPAPSREQIARNSRVHESVLQPMGVDRSMMLRLFSTKVDWNPEARVLTDQYSPANLLRIKGR
jgi:spermidine synthase